MIDHTSRVHERKGAWNVSWRAFSFDSLDSYGRSVRSVEPGGGE
jgi:hypothetical protein